MRVLQPYCCDSELENIEERLTHTKSNSMLVVKPYSSLNSGLTESSPLRSTLFGSLVEGIDGDTTRRHQDSSSGRKESHEGTTMVVSPSGFDRVTGRSGLDRLSAVRCFLLPTRESLLTRFRRQRPARASREFGCTLPWVGGTRRRSPYCSSSSVAWPSFADRSEYRSTARS